MFSRVNLLKMFFLEYSSFIMPFRSSTSLMVQKGVDKRKEVELMKGKYMQMELMNGNLLGKMVSS